MDYLDAFLDRRSLQTWGRAAWFGSVASLLLMLLCLNGFPLQPIQYVTSIRIAGPDEWKGIHRGLLENSAEIISEPVEDRLKIIDVRRSRIRQTTLSRLDANLQTAVERRASPPTTFDVTFLSDERVAESECIASVRTQAARSLPPIPDADRDRERRWASWRRDVVLHSLARVKREVEDQMETSSGRMNQELVDSNSPFSMEQSPFQTASSRTAKHELVDQRLLEIQLSNQLSEIDETISKLDRSGNFETTTLAMVPNSLRVRPFAGRVAPQQLIGLLVVGLGSWLAIGWLYLYIARGAGADPNLVAKWLERLSIPHAGSLCGLVGSEIGRSGRQTNTYETTNWYFSAVDWILMIIGLWIALRFSFDADWRHLFVDQPLSGLSSLLRKV